MKKFVYGLQLMAVAIIIAPAAYGNCYVLENRTNHPVKLQFDYNGPVGAGSVTAVELMPNDHYPRRGQWCWNTRSDQWAKVTITSSEPYRASWEGQLVLGNGGPASPSGRYTLQPPQPSSSNDSDPPQRPRRQWR